MVTDSAFLESALRCPDWLLANLNAVLVWQSDDMLSSSLLLKSTPTIRRPSRTKLPHVEMHKNLQYVKSRLILSHAKLRHGSYTEISMAKRRRGLRRLTIPRTDQRSDVCGSWVALYQAAYDTAWTGKSRQREHDSMTRWQDTAKSLDESV